MRLWLVLLSILMAAQFAVEAQEPEQPRAAIDIQRFTAGRPVPPASNERLAQSDVIEAEIGSTTVAYRSFVNRTPIMDRYDVYPPANIVSFSYEAVDVDTTEPRPVIFFFNGGPGSSSIWLHRTAFGPQKTSVIYPVMDDRDVELYTHENEGFLIDVADLVFVDPVNTGLSRVADDQSFKAFQDLRVDARAMCRFVEVWTEAEGRQDAPIYLAGASYGSLRIAGMASHPTCRRVRSRVDGLIFISGLLDLRLRSSDSILKYVAEYPTLAAATWHRGFVDTDFWNGDRAAYLKAAATYANTVLGPALAQSYRFSQEETQTVIQDFYNTLGLTVPSSRPFKTIRDAAQVSRLLLAHPKMVCLNDARFNCKRGHDLHSKLSLEFLGAKLLEDFADTHWSDLGFEASREEYIVLTGNGFRANWDYRFHKSADGGLGTNLARILSNTLMTRTRPLLAVPPPMNRVIGDSVHMPTISRKPIPKLMVASGLHDLNTPWAAMELALLRAGFESGDFELNLYEGGHMMYLNEQTGYQLARDIRSFVLKD
ncbi:MAG: hypothetical protein AAGG45_07635 [Pseudomonadota bacterium]